MAWLRQRVDGPDMFDTGWHDGICANGMAPKDARRLREAIADQILQQAPPLGLQPTRSGTAPPVAAPYRRSRTRPSRSTPPAGHDARYGSRYPEVEGLKVAVMGCIVNGLAKASMPISASAFRHGQRRPRRCSSTAIEGGHLRGDGDRGRVRRIVEAIESAIWFTAQHFERSVDRQFPGIPHTYQRPLRGCVPYWLRRSRPSAAWSISAEPSGGIGSRKGSGGDRRYGRARICSAESSS